MLAYQNLTDLTLQIEETTENTLDGTLCVNTAPMSILYGFRFNISFSNSC